MRHLKFFTAFFLFSAFIFYYALRLFAWVTPITEVTTGKEGEVTDFTVVLDAGHGGEDSGAVGVTGVLEKDLNFEVVSVLSALLRASGCEVVLTRTEDKLLYTEEENIYGMRKNCDLKNRLKISHENPDALFISIHMNNFTMSQYSGLQVWYSTKREESRSFAEAVQASVREGLQNSNNRSIKAADRNLYLLDRNENPAILIECGFLSNPEECEALSQEDYQKRLCFFIFCAIMNERTKIAE